MGEVLPSESEEEAEESKLREQIQKPFSKLTETEAAYRVRLVNTASYEMDFTPEEIIQRFARGDKARSTQGSGIGLAIAQTYTEALCGQFRILIDGDQFNAIVTLPKKISKMKET